MIKLISPDVTVHHSAEFAIMLCRLIGYREPLIERLNDRNEVKTPAEHEYIASVWADPNHKWPTPSQVAKRREHLRRAAVFLEFLWEGGEGGGKWRHMITWCANLGIDQSTVQTSVKYASELGGGEWWSSAEHLAKKHKGGSLRLHVLGVVSN